ncbi:hypothetical protein GQ42DRAFT_173905 [Ramicandelaber brevisporus]|nr:hypothetical protein GQ42DRAFT_173905 [Ramicandelaber brevisporus]
MADGSPANNGAPDNSTNSASTSSEPVKDGAKKKRRKVAQACVYCRRSHMTCDTGRPCQRCIKRNIGHLCHDEARSQAGAPHPHAVQQQKLQQRQKQQQQQQNTTTTAAMTAGMATIGTSAALTSPTFPRATAGGGGGGGGGVSSSGGTSYNGQSGTLLSRLRSPSIGLPGWRGSSGLSSAGNALLNTGNDIGLGNLFMQSLGPRVSLANEHLGTELSSMTDFLMSLDALNPLLSGGNLAVDSNNGVGFAAGTGLTDINNGINSTTIADSRKRTIAHDDDDNGGDDDDEDIIDAINSSEEDKETRFFLTAADPTTEGTSDERLQQVIKAKEDAGMLKPHDYIRGYNRLVRYMDRHMTNESRARIIKVMSEFRPKFRLVAQSLTDTDLLQVEESFERLLYDYDRVFTAMGVPSCLWRRTGEIHRANREFAELVGLPLEYFRDGHVSIYELMAEQSDVNYWEKYGNIAFDPSQKAVLTSCVLKRHPQLDEWLDKDIEPKGSDGLGTPTHQQQQQQQELILDDGETTACCFSFTIRRDKYNIPMAIVGNFLPTQ